MQVNSMDDDPWEDYETGPFCRHWGDPSECEKLCKCGHQCHEHYDSNCDVDDCQCEDWDEREG